MQLTNRFGQLRVPMARMAIVRDNIVALLRARCQDMAGMRVELIASHIRDWTTSPLWRGALFAFRSKDAAALASLGAKRLWQLHTEYPPPPGEHHATDKPIV